MVSVTCNTNAANGGEADAEENNISLGDEIQEIDFSTEETGDNWEEVTESTISTCMVEDQVISNGNVALYIASKIINCWEQQHQSDQTMRKTYAKSLIWVLVAQVVLSGAIFMGIGIKFLTYDNFTINLFVSVAYVQALGLVYIVVKYLFSKDGHVSIKDLTEFVNKSVATDKEKASSK